MPQLNMDTLPLAHLVPYLYQMQSILIIWTASTPVSKFTAPTLVLAVYLHQIQYILIISTPVSTSQPHLLFWQFLSNDFLIHWLALFPQLLLHQLDTISLHIASTHKHALQSPQTKVVVRLVGQLLITQPESGTKLLN